MDNLKEAFSKVKTDIDFLKNELFSLKEEIAQTRKVMVEACEIVKQIQDSNNKELQAQKPINQTNIPNNKTENTLFKPSKLQNLPISTGNQGVPTDRQTNQQTDRHIDFLPKKPEIEDHDSLKDPINSAAEILDSLDNIKKEIRLKFKRLTEQELLIFSTLYQLTQNQETTDYKTISAKLNLSESSIRDYVGKLIKKGIPVDKVKVNNKNIRLKVATNLRKIASLSTILQLREL
jgi:hypothetical protein